MKRCSFCRIEKPFSEFYAAHQGKSYAARCKACFSRKWRQCATCEGSFIGLAQQRYCSAACRKLSRPRTARPCNHCGTLFYSPHSNVRHCSRLCGQAARSDRKALLPKRKRTSIAARAHSMVYRAIAAGTLVRPTRCENDQCGRVGRVDAAHYDYSEPLRVRWLCRSCHRLWDREEPKGGTHRPSLLESAHPLSPSV